MPGEMWGFEEMWGGERGEREEGAAQTKTQIWSVEDYILLAWALLMEAQRSSSLGRADTGHARKKILIFQYFLTLFCVNIKGFVL